MFKIVVLVSFMFHGIQTTGELSTNAITFSTIEACQEHVKKNYSLIEESVVRELITHSFSNAKVTDVDCRIPGGEKI